MKRSYKKAVMGEEEMETKEIPSREITRKKRKFVFTKQNRIIEADSLSEAKELLENDNK